MPSWTRIGSHPFPEVVLVGAVHVPCIDRHLASFLHNDLKSNPCASAQFCGYEQNSEGSLVPTVYLEEATFLIDLGILDTLIQHPDVLLQPVLYSK